MYFYISLHACRETQLSLGLAAAVRGLEGDLARLSVLLDAVLFRQLWRFAAVGIQQTLFNEVATEAQFSQQVLYCTGGPASLTL